MRRALIYLLSVVLVLVVIVVGGIALAFHYYGRDLPDHKKLAAYDPPVATRLHAGDGRLLAEYAIERRVYVPLSAIPKLVVSAFLSAEDKNFYEHFGVDPVSVVSAMIKNVSNMGGDKKMVGASTITQQVAKNFLLTPEVSFSRKIKEALLAIRIERSYTKVRILELYLNQIYLGSGSYGVAAAALYYFNKSLDELTIGEAAYLAALPKAPNNYNPTRHHDAAITRRNWVIAQMLENGAINSAEVTAAMAEPLTIQKRTETEIFRADYFVEEARRWLLQTYGEDRLYRGGLSVHTTLDPKLQAIAERTFRNGLATYDRRHGWRGPLARLLVDDDWQSKLATVAWPEGAAPEWRIAMVTGGSGGEAGIGFVDGRIGTIALDDLAWARLVNADFWLGPPIKKVDDALKAGDVILVEPKGPDTPERYVLRQVPAVSGGMVAMDPHNGRVLAMVGGVAYYANSEFNRATQASRQPGSAFKPFIYLTALDRGFTPSTIIMDAPVVLEQGPGLPLWRPENYEEDFHGPSTMRYGLEHSRNLMTVRVAQAVGMDAVADTARRFGIYDNLPRYLSGALGSAETTLIRLTTAYAMLVNGGKKIEPVVIERIQDKTGMTIYRRDARLCDGCKAAHYDASAPPVLPDLRETVADPVSAYQIVSMLEGVVKRGTASVVRSLDIPLAGKTGTTNDQRDAWFVGFSPDLVVGIFIGYDTPRNLGSKETGGRVSAPIFREFMAEALADKPAVPFRVPNGVRFVRVDLDTGALPKPGDKTIILEAFRPGTEPNRRAADGGSNDTATPAESGGSGDENSDSSLDGIY